MKHTYYNTKRELVTVWNEIVNGSYDYWMKVNGLAQSITKRQFENHLKKSTKS